MARLNRSPQDWAHLFSEFEFLLSFGMHPEHAVRQLEYPSVEALCRAYHRQGRPQPAALTREEQWLVHRRRVAS